MVKLDTVHSSNRNFIIFTKHRRLKRLWQFFFTGWGLVMIVALIAGTLFSQQLLWTPISAINMTDIVSNQFKMSGASFAGTDQNGEPFKLRAATGRQEYDNPDTIFLTTVSGTTTRIQDGKKVIYDFTARNGEYNRKDKNIRLTGDVRVNISTGDKILTDEMVIKL
ncbi:MAG: LPS export ABC transporter periplasmic protein LptC [Alphaproteobacteria bacterium]|nr:LPS export ABC transporter periplasmic protein LptC [Alphaproteobacteria bacterium]MBQ7949394.1 LPS export ABC transporter periplasmic protein LptC [Alphaproteobacteria bacterium]MBR2342168.1 LPS export ABC transporter periplasmic protein LptC [Alphaproteobacteria bacterium]